MPSQITIATCAFGAALLHRLRTWLAVQDRRRAHRTEDRRRLTVSDRELADIGVTREAVRRTLSCPILRPNPPGRRQDPSLTDRARLSEKPP